MIDYFAKVDFSETVWTLDDTGTVHAHTLADLCRQHCDHTTTPEGIAPTFHTRDNELWTWGTGGNNPRKVAAFDTEKEAGHALLLSHLFDLENRLNVAVFYRLEDAQSEAADFIN